MRQFVQTRKGSFITGFLLASAILGAQLYAAAPPGGGTGQESGETIGLKVASGDDATYTIKQLPSGAWCVLGVSKLGALDSNCPAGATE